VLGCFGLVVSTCQVIGHRKTPLMTPSQGEIISTKPKWKSVICVFFFCLVYLCCYVFPSARPYICLWHDIAYLCWKCRQTPTKQNKLCTISPGGFCCWCFNVCN